MAINKIAPLACPFCGEDAEPFYFKYIEGLEPTPNHVTMCGDCFGLCQFNDDLTLRKIDPEKFAELRRNEEFWKHIEETRSLLKLITIIENAVKKNSPGDDHRGTP